MQEHPESADLNGVVTAFRRRRWLIAACVAIGAGSALAVSLFQTPQYSATASLLFRDPGFDQRLFGSSAFQTTDPTREAETNVTLVSLDVVADRTAAELDGGLSGSDVSQKIDVEAEGQSDVAAVTATDPSPSFAATLADAFARNYIAFRRHADREKVAQARRMLERDYAALDPLTKTGAEGQLLQHQITQLQTLRALQTGNAELVQRADIPASPSSPDTVRNTIYGGILGLLLGLIFALMRERLDRRLKEPKEFEETFSLPILAGVPESKALGRADNGMPALPVGDAESFRMLRTRLRYFNVDRGIRSVLVTSPSAQDGKTTVAWNFAQSAAETGSRTILVEADFHRPTIASRRGLEPLPGLAELLSGQVSLNGVTQQVPLDRRSNGQRVEHYLDVIVAGATPPNASQLMESTEMKTLIGDLGTRYDLVVVDTAPAGIVADTIPLITLVDGVVVVGRIGKTTRDEASHLRDQLRELDAPVLGIVANGVKSRRGYYGYYGGYAGVSGGRRRFMLTGRR
jgi:succinoglycan biosynthesis transport protein ExoP